METIRIIGLIVISVAMFGCSGGLPSGPTDTHRGEADAINPARNVTLTCNEKNNSPNTITTTITNNCNKDSLNNTAEPVVVHDTPATTAVP